MSSSDPTIIRLTYVYEFKHLHMLQEFASRFAQLMQKCCILFSANGHIVHNYTKWHRYPFAKLLFVAALKNDRINSFGSGH